VISAQDSIKQMLIGSYIGVLGEKRRVAIPKKFIPELGERPIIAKWYEDCIILVNYGFWEALLDRLTGKSKVVSLGVRDIERFILGSAFEAEPDKQGRIIIPEVLSAYAGLKKEVMFIGLSDRVEIWNKEIWDKKANELSKTTKEYIEGVSKNGS
jgi:transcriptional regulator MraZ